MLTTMEAAVVRSGSVSQDGISSRGGATEAKLKLLEARLTGGGNGQQRRQDLGGDPGLDDVLGPARFGSSRSPLAAVPAANGRLGTPPPVVPGKQQRPSTSGGRGEAAQSCLLLASPSVQLDTSLDSEDVSGSRGSRGGWGIQGAPGCGGGTTSRRVSLPGGKGESLQGALQAAEEGAR